jgi:DNA-binding transcriptional ArsR family regulator
LFCLTVNLFFYNMNLFFRIMYFFFVNMKLFFSKPDLFLICIDGSGRKTDYTIMNISSEPTGTTNPLPTASNVSTGTSGRPENPSAPAAEPARIKLRHLGRVLHEPARWRILRELARGEALPVKELAARVRCPAASVSKHMALLRKAGMVKTGYGRLYKLSALMQVSPDGRTLDACHCVLKLDTDW